MCSSLQQRGVPAALRDHDYWRREPSTGQVTHMTFDVFFVLFFEHLIANYFKWLWLQLYILSVNICRLHGIKCLCRIVSYLWQSWHDKLPCDTCWKFETIRLVKKMFSKLTSVDTETVCLCVSVKQSIHPQNENVDFFCPRFRQCDCCNHPDVCWRTLCHFRVQIVCCMCCGAFRVISLIKHNG